MLACLALGAAAFQAPGYSPPTRGHTGRASSIGGDAPDAGLTAEYEIEYAGAFGGARLNVSYSAAGNSPTPHDFSRSYSKSTEELMEQMTARLRRRAAANFNADVLPSLRGDRRAQARCTCARNRPPSMLSAGYRPSR